MKSAVINGRVEEVDDSEIDVELAGANRLVGSHANQIPLISAVAPARTFYGARFVNQAVPLEKPEAPLVQNLDTEDPEGRSFDEKLTEQFGGIRAPEDGEVVDVRKGRVKFRTQQGEDREFEFSELFPFNRKTALEQVPVVRKGDRVTRGSLLVRSNFLDDKGTVALGVNAKIAMVPYKGWTMDDAVAISEGFAKRLSSRHHETYLHEVDGRQLKGGLQHFSALFPTKYKRQQLEMLDEDGVVRPGTIVMPGDPIALATAPRTVSSLTSALGQLGRSERMARRDASLTWEGSVPAKIRSVHKGRSGYKVLVEYVKPADLGDKITLRNGQKGVVSKIIPDDLMLRDQEGSPFDVLLNPLGMPSRINTATPYELLLGKVARKLGRPEKLPPFTADGGSWHDFVRRRLQDAGLSPEEPVFDPEDHKILAQPVLTGYGFVQRLHHIAEGKSSSRSTGSYDQDMQPAKGSENGAKRISGLEVGGLLSAGAYANLREMSTLRGQRSDAYWRQVREGADPKPPGRPFVWDKFRALLAGSGLNTKDLPGGRIRLGILADRHLDARRPLEVKRGDLVDPETLEPVPDGLFDPRLAAPDQWGYIPLPQPLPNPAAEDTIRTLLGLTKKELREVLSGQRALPRS